METREPIIYDYELDVRFDDLDSYGHVNSTRYLDYVSTSRLLYMERVIGMSVSEVAKRGYGWYMIKASQEFLRAINGLARVRIRSHVASNDGPTLLVVFEMSDPEGKRIYSKGTMEFATMDLKSGRPCIVPDWMQDLFLTGGT